MKSKKYSSRVRLLAIPAACLISSLGIVALAADDGGAAAKPPVQQHSVTLQINGAPAAVGAANNGNVAATQPVASAEAATPAPATPAPSTEPANEASSAKVPAKVSDAARKELDALKTAYANLKTLDLVGTLTATFDIGGHKEDHSSEFTSSFQAANKFRHAMKDDIVLGATGDKTYAFKQDANEYITKDQPKEKMTLANLPPLLSKIITQQNPSLALALSPDPSDFILTLTEAQDVKTGDDLKVDGKSYATLVLSSPNGDMTLAIDPQTHLIRRVEFDRRKYFETKGQTDVKKALISFDYATSTPDAPATQPQNPKNDAYVWTPPAGAKDVTSVASAAEAPSAVAALEGKPAPDFKLKGLDGKEVSLSALKGNVVIVDFWATWCGPCVASLPALNKLYEDKKADGLKVIAVSVDQDTDKVAPFAKEHNLTIPIAIDTEDVAASQKYQAESIPETIVVGKDGVVRKVFVGFDPGSTESLLHKEVAAAMAAPAPK